MTAAAGKSDAFEAAHLDFFLGGVAITGLPTATSGNFYIALYTADPTEEVSSATTNEAAYTNYARQPILRVMGAGGWSRSGNTASNQAQISFPQCGTTGATVTHWALVSSASGAGSVFYVGALTASLAVSNGITPQLAANALTITES